VCAYVTKDLQGKTAALICVPITALVQVYAPRMGVLACLVALGWIVVSSCAPTIAVGGVNVPMESASVITVSRG
jgi:hypothetical protein